MNKFSEYKNKFNERILNIVRDNALYHNITEAENNVKIALTKYLDSLVKSQIIYNYIILCDETINTLEIVNQNSFLCKIGIQETKSDHDIDKKFFTDEDIKKTTTYRLFEIKITPNNSVINQIL